MSQKYFDDILTRLGTGKWNLLIYTGVGLCAFLIPAFVLNGSFVAPDVNFKCVVPPDLNITKMDKCHYVSNYSGPQGETHLQDHKCSKWDYETDVFPTSLTSEFDLVCDRAYLRPTYQTIYMLGNLICAPVNGFLADRYGRKTMMTFGAFLGVASMLVTSFVSDLTCILVLRFLIGFSHPPLMQSGFILSMEVCQPKYRSHLGILISLPWAFGTMWWGVLAYLIDDWRWLQRASTLQGIIFITCFLWLIDESPRWQIVTGSHDKALKTLKKAAKWNNSSLPSDEELLYKMKEIQESAISKGAKEKERNSSPTTCSEKLKHFMKLLGILYKTPKLRHITLLMYVLFIISSTVFYGLSLNAVNFNLDPYMYVIVGGLMEVPAYTITVPVIDKLGRIPPALASYMICGITIMMLAFLPSEPQWLVITFAMIGKFCISVAYAIIYVVAAEIFPTEVRMQAIGTSNLVSRIGSIISPYITDGLGPIYPWVPSVMFGSFSLLASVATYFVPETLNKNPPETIVQLEEEDKIAEERCSQPDDKL